LNRLNIPTLIILRMLNIPPRANEGERMGVAHDSLISHGCIVSGGKVIRSVLSLGVRVDNYSEVDRSILLQNVRVARNCRIRRAIVEAGVLIPEDSSDRI